MNDRSAAWIVSKLKKGKGFPRWGINARALETIILDDLESFRRARDGERKDPTTDGNRVTAFNRLKRDEVAYRVVSERLQTLQNQALVAGNKDRANDLSQAQQPLFSAYLKLAAVLRNPDAEPENRTQTPINMTQVRKACADGEAVAKAFQDKEKATDNLYLNALKRDTGPAPPAAAVSEDRHRKRERRRFLVLSSVAALLAAVCVLMYVPVLRGKSGDIEVPVSELSSGSGVTRVMAIGPMMYAQVNRRAWDDLTESERIARVNELGESAVSRGFETLYLTDEKRQDLANWTRNGGAKLAR